MVRRWQASGGQMAEVLRAMFTSAAFIASLRQPQFKDPMRYVLSALRATLGTNRSATRSRCSACCPAWANRCSDARRPTATR
jgi:Protein of unknown function (DUF1800).